MYQALYRTWRPKTFDDVISQPHITTALRNQLIQKKTAHAYLFTGSRGTGKTTCARILAKAMNCPNSQNGAPCCSCDICRDADAGTLSDIIEIDAASNNSVEDVRELREGTVYLPERCPHKVYIIDEVHMLSPSAFNALLKVMEEPPDYVTFILATTEIHKVPATILSRCQRYDFRRIRSEDIVNRLLYIAQQESITLDADAAALIAKVSDGGMRDAISLLDQCAAFAPEITSEIVASAAGVAGRDYLFSILDAILHQQTGTALQLTDNLYDRSKDMVRLCEELIEQLRNMMLIRLGNVQPDLLTCMPGEIPQLTTLAQQAELPTILHWISILQDARERMQRNPGKRVELELALIRLSTPMQIQAQPQQFAAPVASAATQQASSSAPAAPKETAASKAAVPEPAQPQQEPLQAADFRPVAQWADILAAYRAVNPAVSGSLAESTAFENGNLLLIVAKNRFFLTLLKNKEHAKSLGETVARILGKEYRIRAKCSEPEESENKAQALIQKAMDSQLETAVE